MQKLEILTDAAKYDVACTSSGVERKGDGKYMGNCTKAGICHSFCMMDNSPFCIRYSTLSPPFTENFQNQNVCSCVYSS